METKPRLIALGVSFITSVTALTTLPALGAETKTGRDARLLEEVVVVAHPLSGEGLAQASDVLDGKELARKMDSLAG